MTTDPKLRVRRRIARRFGADSAPEASAALLFEQFSLDWLRTIARGGHAGEASRSLMNFVELAQSSRIPWRGAIEAAAGTLERRRQLCAAASQVDAAMFDVARAALFLLVEASATDRFAPARRSARSLYLHAATGRFIHACELQSRSEGWSYLDLLAASIRSSSDQS